MYKHSGKSVNHLLSYCSPALVYGVHVVCSLLGNAEVCGLPSSMLAREVWSASQQYCLDGCHWLFLDTVASLLSNWYYWLDKYSLNVWNLLPVCIMWLV